MSVEKLHAFAGVTHWAEARQVGKKTYDDRKFIESLREQVDAGRRLSPPQAGVLDRILLKYTAQIPDFEARSAAWGMVVEPQAPDHESGPLLELMRTVTTFDPPVKRGKREWSDEEFFKSLSSQFERKKSLSPKQRGALKKMAARYAGQIPSYLEQQEALGLPPPRKPKAAKKGGEDGPEEDAAMEA